MFWCYSGLDKDGFEKKFINNEIGKNIFSWSHSLTQFSMRMSMSVEISKFIGVLCWLIIYGFMSNPAQEYFSYMEMSVSHHHCLWKAAQFRPMLGAQDLWAERDLYRATPTVTRYLNFSGLIRRTAPFNHLLRHTSYFNLNIDIKHLWRKTEYAWYVGHFKLKKKSNFQTKFLIWLLYGIFFIFSFCSPLNLWLSIVCL